MKVIAISGPPGVGSTSVAKAIAKKLGLKCFIPGKTLKAYAGEAKEAKAALDVLQTEWGRSQSLHRSLDEAQRSVAKQGSVVVCGKLSIHFLKDLADTTIWIHAPLKVRAERVAKRDNVPLEEAQRLLSEREKIERRMWKSMYGFDYFNQAKDADLVLNTANLTLEQTVERILNFIKSRSKS